MHWLWRFAEAMDWRGVPPKGLWRALLRWQDRRNGYHFTYED